MSDNGWIALAALVGVLARLGSWKLPAGGVDWWKAVGELVSVPAIAFIVSGAVAYVDSTLDIRIVCALSALCGLVGVAGIEAYALKYLNKKAGL